MSIGISLIIKKNSQERYPIDLTSVDPKKRSLSNNKKSTTLCDVK